MAIRNLLPITLIDEFKEYLESMGYMILPVCSPYELVRAKNKKKKDTIVIYLKCNARFHTSVMDKDYEFVRKFLEARKHE